MVSKKIIFLSLFFVFFAAAIYSTFVQAERCDSFECFQEKMRECDKVRYLNDAEDATWRYEIREGSLDDCRVEVTLLQPKGGELGLERLAGLNMGCTYPKGVATYPEKNLDRCHGILKEELQALVIEKLHTYIIDNLGEIQTGLVS